MFNYECELCNKSFCTTDEQKNPVCNNCKEIYNISDDYIYGTGEYAEKENPDTKKEKKEPKTPVGDGKTCVMCGKKNAGKYYVCDACIFEYNLTQEQLNEMGGLREKSDQTSNLATQKNEPKKPEVQHNVEKDEKLSTYSKEETEDNYLRQLHNIDSKLDSLIELENRNVSQNDRIDNAMYDDVVKALWSIAANIKTIKSITLFMFVLFIIGVIYAFLVTLSY